MSDEPRIMFRGMRMLTSWPARLEAAQLETTCRPNGVVMPRVRYGDEPEDWGADRKPCHDCGAVKGEYHVPGVRCRAMPGVRRPMWRV